MRKRLEAILFTIIIFSLFTTACKKTVTKEVIVTDTVQHAWKQITNYNMYANTLFNSANIGDTQLVVAGNTSYILCASLNGSGTNYLMGYPYIGTSLFKPATSTPYINKDLCAYRADTALYIMAVPVVNSYAYITYKPRYTAGYYSAFVPAEQYPSLTYPTSVYPVIGNKYLLTPVEFSGNGNTQVHFDLLSFDYKQSLSINGFLDTPAVKRITVTSDPSTIGFYSSGYFCASFYNKFFVYYGGQFFRVDTTGNVKTFGYMPASGTSAYGVYNMFTANNMLFVKSGAILFYSQDQGESWQVFNDYSSMGSTVGMLVFRNVGTKLYATIADQDSQLWKVTFTDRVINFAEINNDGLENNIVTSITQCGRYDFITTATGIFSRDTALVDQLKQPIR